MQVLADVAPGPVEIGMGLGIIVVGLVLVLGLVGGVVMLLRRRGKKPD